MDIVAGFATLFSDPVTLGFVVLAAFTGVIVGATPGLTSAAAIAMLVPATFFMEPLPALAFLYVIGKSGRFGGSISAILFNTPGTAAAAATQIDGHPMYRAGKGGKAMKTAAISSMFGDFVGDLLLIFGAVWIASFTEGLGPPELFAVYLTAFIVISSVVGSSIIKGLISTAAGIIIAAIGTDPMTAGARLDFGILNFQSGMSLVPLLIGMFVLSEIALQLEQLKSRVAATEVPAPDEGDSSLSLAEVKRCLPIMARSSVIGAVIGILPGLGSSVAAFASYGEAKRKAKNPNEWGTGIVEGIAAPESANNAVSGPTMIPLLALGVPGSTIAAILMGVFLIHGIPIGPQIFVTSRELVFGLFAAGLVGIALYGMIGYFGSAFIGRMIAKVPTRLIYPYIFLTCFISAFAARASVFDVFVMCAAGMLGYLMRKNGYSTAAFIIAFVLAGGAEETLRQSLLLSNDGALILLQRPIALMFFGFGILVVAARLWQKYRAPQQLA